MDPTKKNKRSINSIYKNMSKLFVLALVRKMSDKTF